MQIRLTGHSEGELSASSAQHSTIRRNQWRRRVAFLAFGVPAMVWFLVWMLWPLINMFRISLLRWDGLVKASTFIGLANYQRMFTDDLFFYAMRNTGIHLLFGMPLALIPAFFLGFFMSLRLPGFRAFRFICFIPAMVSVAALAMMFYGIYMPEGILNAVLRLLGLSAWTHNWLADPKTVFGSIIFIDIWTGIGFYAVLFFAVLSNLPNELYESARLDGASLWTILWRIAFPLSKGFFGVVTMLHFLWILTSAAQNVLILTKGGPGHYSLTLGYYLYNQAFVTQRLGYSQAIGVFLFIVGMVGLVIIRQIFRQTD